MKFTMMAVDTIPKFRLAAFPHPSTHPEIWQLDVMSIQEVANVLGSLGFLDSEVCDRLANANTTVTPQPGLNTIPLTALGDFIRVASPGEEPPSEEAQDGYMLMVQGETTEEKLAAFGFVATTDGLLQ